MKKTLARLLLTGSLALGGSAAVVTWEWLSGPSCLELQGELRGRIESYARLHLPEPAPQVIVQGDCRYSPFVEAFAIRARNLLWWLDKNQKKPIQFIDLRRGLTRDLLDHPDSGDLRFTVGFDAQLNATVRQQLEDLVSHYLRFDSADRHQLDFRRLKNLPEQRASAGIVADQSKRMRKSLNESKRDLAAVFANGYAALINIGAEPMQTDFLRLVTLLCIFAFAFIGIKLMIYGIRMLSAGAQRQPETAAQDEAKQISVLFGPRFTRDMSERISALWQLLVQLNSMKARKLVLNWWQKDRNGLMQLLAHVNSEVKGSILQALTVEQIVQLSERLGAVPPSLRDAQRAVLRVLLDIARELSSCCKLTDLPLFIHMMTKNEWQRVSQQLTRPRRHILAAQMDSERASWLRAKQDLQPACLQSSNAENVPIALLFQGIKAVLQLEADQLREQLSIDREAMKAIDSFFADLTLDASLNSELAMLILGSCHANCSGFSRLVERADPLLLEALTACNTEQIALVCYELDPQLKVGLCSRLGERRDAVAAALGVLQADKSHSKSLRMQARSLQRFLERQVLVAEVLCSGSV